MLEKSWISVCLWLNSKLSLKQRKVVLDKQSFLPGYQWDLFCLQGERDLLQMDALQGIFHAVFTGCSDWHCCCKQRWKWSVCKMCLATEATLQRHRTSASSKIICFADQLQLQHFGRFLYLMTKIQRRIYLRYFLLISKFCKLNRCLLFQESSPARARGRCGTKKAGRSD